MKAKTFETLIRKIVREEIDYSLRREIRSLKEDLRERAPIITEEPIEQIPENVKSSLKEKIMGKPPAKKQTNKIFSSNSTLNDLLNETAMGDTNTNSPGMSPASLSESFTPDSPEIMDTTGMPEEVANAVTRDYSDLMKAIKKKKK